MKSTNGQGRHADRTRCRKDALTKKGKIHLTTHRLLFHALLPPDSAYTAQTDEGSSRPDVIHSGPITIHKSGLASARRVWMELGAEMATTYPRADEKGRVRPLRCILSESHTVI